jgi:hypothetical protein
MLIHYLQYDLILFLVLLVQRLNSYSRQSKYSSEPTLRLLMIHLLLLLLLRLFLLLLFRRILIVLASMLPLDLTLHVLLRESEVTPYSLASPICRVVLLP